MKAWRKGLFTFGLLIGASLISASGYTQEPDLQTTLGAAASIVKHATRVETACLKTVAASESRKHAFKTTDRIVGYPITDPLKAIDSDSSQQLATLLLDKTNYADVRQRCANQYFHGIRFHRDHDLVEVAIGVPCNQVLVVFPAGNETKWWGGVLGTSSANKVLSLVKNRPAANPANNTRQ